MLKLRREVVPKHISYFRLDLNRSIFEIETSSFKEVCVFFVEIAKNIGENLSVSIV